MRPKTDRNKEICEKIYMEHWSIRQVGNFYHLGASTVHEIYHRDLKKFKKEFDRKLKSSGQNKSTQSGVRSYAQGT